MTSDPKVCSHNSNSFFKRRRLKFSYPSDCAECYRNQLCQGLIEEIKHRPWIVRTLRASCFFSVPHAYSPPTIDAFGWGTLNCMWEGEIILISCRPYWLLVEVRLQFAFKLTVNVLPIKPYKWAVLLAYTSHNLEYFIVETTFAKDQAPDHDHLHPVRLSAIFAQAPTLVHIFLLHHHLAIVELTKRGKIHTEAVLSKQKLRRTTRVLWMTR